MSLKNKTLQEIGECLRSLHGVHVNENSIGFVRRFNIKGTDYFIYPVPHYPAKYVFYIRTVIKIKSQWGTQKRNVTLSVQQALDDPNIPDKVRDFLLFNLELFV